MARIVQLLEIALSGSSFRIELAGAVALTNADGAVAVVRVDTLADAERLETLASALRLTFRWQEGHDRKAAISIAALEKLLSGDAHRFLTDEGRARLGFVLPLAEAPSDDDAPPCDDCGAPRTPGYPCDVCGPVDFNYPGKHD